MGSQYENLTIPLSSKKRAMKTKSVELRSSAARKWEYIDKYNLFAITLNPIVLLISRLTLPRLPGPNLTNGQLRVSLPPISVSRWSRVSGPVSPSRVLLCHAASRGVTQCHAPAFQTPSHTRPETQEMLHSYMWF